MAWFERLNKDLKGFGFISNRYDPSVFIFVTLTYNNFILSLETLIPIFNILLINWMPNLHLNNFVILSTF